MVLQPQEAGSWNHPFPPPPISSGALPSLHMDWDVRGLTSLSEVVPDTPTSGTFLLSLTGHTVSCLVPHFGVHVLSGPGSAVSSCKAQTLPRCPPSSSSTPSACRLTQSKGAGSVGCLAAELAEWLTGWMKVSQEVGARLSRKKPVSASPLPY